MAEGSFDIYQTTKGYVAVTSPIRRQIMEALAAGERDLPHLVEVTGNSKPTLSNVHMRELLAQGLIEELPHPTDARRKLYRVTGRRIGSSEVPVEELRGAVKAYVSLSPFAFSLPFKDIVSVLLAEGVSPDAVRIQARAVGVRASSLFHAPEARDLLSAVAAFWERETLARAARLDFERLELEVVLDEGWHAPKDLALALLGGFLEGVLRARLSPEWGVRVGRPKAGRVVLGAIAPKG